MTDLGTVGFGADTSELVKLQDELDRLKAKVDSLNSSLKNMDPSSSAAKAKLAELKVATNDFQSALGNLVDKQLAAGKTTQALDTIVKSTGATYQQAAQSVKEVIAAHAQAEGAVGKTASALGAAGRAAADSGAEASRSGGFFSSLAAMLGLSAGSADKHTIAAHAMGAAHHSASEGAKVLRESVHTLIPALEEAGLKISTLTAYSGALRAGLPALGLAIAGGISVAVAKASDEADLAKRRLEGLAGVKMGDAFADNLKKVSHELGTSREAAAPAFEALSKIANLNTPPGGVRIIEPGQPQLLNATSISADNLAKSYEAIFMQLRLGGAETKQATEATNKFFQDLASNGKVTSQMVDELRKVAPQAATSLANAFTHGKQNVDQFIESLKKTPMSLKEILELLPKLREGSAGAFKELQEKPITVAGAVDKLKESFEKLWKTIDGGDKDRPGAIAQFITQVAGDIESFNTAVENAKAGTDDWNTNLGTLFGTLKMVAGPFKQIGTDIADVVRGFKESSQPLSESAGFFETLGHAVGVASKAVGSFVSIIGGGLATGLGAIGSFVMDSIQKLTDWANQAISLAKQVATAIASAASSVPGALSGGGGTGNFDQTGASTGVGPGNVAATQGQDAGAPGFDVGVSDIGGFASGGSFVVGGTGSTDSQLIQFMATPGERVTIDTPDATGGAGAKTLGQLLPASGGAGSGAGVSGDLITAHIDESIKTQTEALKDKLNLVRDAIIGAINSVTAAVKSLSNVAATTGSATPTTSTSSNTGLTTSTSASSYASSAAAGGGGGFSTRKDPEDSKTAAYLKQQQAAADKAEQDAYNKLSQQQKFDQDNGVTRGTSTIKSVLEAFGVTQPKASPSTTPQPGTAQKDGVGHPPYAGQLDAQGLPLKNPPYAPGTDPMTAGLGPEDVNKISDASKDSGKTVAETVKDQTGDINSIGDQTNKYLDSVDDATRQGAVATQAGTDATRQGTDATRSGLDGVEGATNATTEGVAATTGAVESGANSITASIESLAPQIANAVASASSSGAGSPGGASFGSSGAGGGYNAMGDYAGYGGAAGGGDSSAGGGSRGGGSPGSGYDSYSGAYDGTNASGGFTPSAAYFAQGMDTGPSFADSFSSGMSAMAVGGQFTVTGAGTTDTEHVEFMATPGETVTVTPPGGTPPPNPSFGSGPSTKTGMMAFATGGQFTLGNMMGEPSLVGADVVAAHLHDSQREQTESLKQKLDQIADKIIQAIHDSSSQITRVVQEALKAAASAARVQSFGGAGSSGGATYSGGQSGSAFGIDANGNNSFGNHVITDQESEQQFLARGYYKTADGGFKKAIVFTGGGGFAEGGAFTVPGGGGGSDSVNLAIKASPGEKIIVLPPEKAKALDDLKNAIRVSPEALSKFMPALQDNIPGGGMGAIASGGASSGGLATAAEASSHRAGGGPPIQIVVQQGVQADDFIRSRAQIQRAMG